jgi:hypothetical protein
VLFPAPRSRKTPLDQARAVWNGSIRTGDGEKQDRYHQRCFGDRDVLGEEFVAITMAVFEPLLRNARVPT